MSEELNNNTPQEEIIKEVKVEEPTADIVVDDAPTTEPEVKEEVPPADTDVEPASEEKPSEEVQEPEKEDESPTEEKTEEEEKEEKAEEKVERDSEPTEPEVKEEEKKEAEPEESIEEIKARIEEEKAIVAEEKSIVDFERQARADEDQLTKFEQALSDVLVKNLNDIGVDINKSIEEIRKEDPEKALRVQQLIVQAQASHEAFVAKQTAEAKARLEEIVFTRASRLLEKFGLSNEEAPIVAETFVNIINEAGLKNLDADLVAKVELAVGRAKLLVPKVAKAVEQVKDIAHDVKETVTEIMTPAPEVTAGEVVATAEAIIEAEPPKAEPKADLSEFKEGISNSQVVTRSGKSLLEEMASITNPKERVEFYKQNFKAIEEALRTEANKK